MKTILLLNSYFAEDAACVAKGAVSAMLCLLLVVPPSLPAQEMQLPAAKSTAPLTQLQRIEHALNRLTFGPRPGDEEAVRRMGLDTWFSQQLHPEKIDDSALERRLDAFPAMRLSEDELIQRFPTPQLIRQLAGKDATPSDPVEHAIYTDAIAAYQAQQAKKTAADAQAKNSVGDAMQPAATEAAPDPSAAGVGLMADLATAGAASGSNAGVAAKDRLSQPEIQSLLAVSADERFGQLVAMSPEKMLALRAGLRALQRPLLVAGMTPQQMEAVEAMTGPARVVGAEVLELRFMRDLYTTRQLQAVMADFWLNHFNVYIRKNQNEPYLLPAYLRETILPNSLGKFEDLLVATAKSPAMLVYLDNWESVGPDSVAATRVKKVQAARPDGKAAQELPKGINENYARELMELHTLGVNGGYTQQDVIEVAKCFTGWTISRPAQVAFGATGGFTYEPNRHEPGAKTVLGQRIPEGGENEGLAVLHMLANSPATAHFVSQELAVRFVSDDPSPKLVNAMAATWLRTGGDIRAVLTTMFHAPEFWSPQGERAKVKTPLEFLLSAARASDAEVTNPLPLVQSLGRLGMPLYGMQTPNGYSWKADEWVSSNALVSRMNFALVLSGNRLPGTQIGWPALLGGDASASAETEQRLETLLLGQPAAERTRAAVLAQAANPNTQQQAVEDFTAQPTTQGDPNMMRVNLGRKGKVRGFAGDAQPPSEVDAMAGLLLGSPEFQRR